MQTVVCFLWCRPVLIEAAMQLTFHYKVLANATELPAVGGTVDSYVDSNGNVTTLPYVVPGSTAFYNARCGAGQCCCSLWAATCWASELATAGVCVSPDLS